VSGCCFHYDNSYILMLINDFAGKDERLDVDFSMTTRIF
jgi:hypothetical protein